MKTSHIAIASEMQRFLQSPTQVGEDETFHEQNLNTARLARVRFLHVLVTNADAQSAAATAQRDGAIENDADASEEDLNAKQLSKSSENSKEGLNASTNKRNFAIKTTVSPFIRNLNRVNTFELKK